MPDDALPEDVQLVRTTPVFDETSVPAGLLRTHRIAEGVWGRLVVRSGSLRFALEDGDEARRIVTADAPLVIPPARPHHVELLGPVSFVVEFHERR